MATQTKEKKAVFDVKKLKKDDAELFVMAQDRVKVMQEARKNHHGQDLDALWSNADRDYVPHRLTTTGKKVIATDEERGWRGSVVRLGSDDWQSDVSQSNPYVKIQTALAILIDQNPSGVFTAASKKYQATNELIKQLYERSWEIAKSRQQLKLFVFNLAKYGWAIGRTYPLKVDRTVKVLKEYNPDDPEKSVYEETEVCVYNDIMRENLDPRNAWIDDMTKPSDQFSMRDWCWRKVYDMDVAKEQFGSYPRWKEVQAGGTLSETIEPNNDKASAEVDTKNQVEVLFYENIVKDVFCVMANGVPVILEPLPIADASGNKKLSCWFTFWNLRHSQSPYGIGIYEAIRYDQGLLDRIRNMSIDQLTLSIYKMFFYQGTQSLTEGGEILIKPGTGKQVLDPKAMEWLEVPGPGKEAWEGIERFRQDVDEASGIGDPLLGQVTGKTAFEIAQAKESALKRLKNPLDNILDALNTEGYLTVALVQLLYSIPETYQIADPLLIEDYLKETKADPDLYERGVEQDEEGNAQETFTAKVYREFPLNLDKDEKGNLIETEDTRFFRANPKYLRWEGIIQIKAQSLLTPSKQIDKALDLEMYNILFPLMSQMAQERMFFLQAGMPASINDMTHGKAAQELVRLYDKDPRDIFPEAWMKAEEKEEPLFVDVNQQKDQMMQQMGVGQGGAPQQGPQAPPQAPGGAQGGQLTPDRLVGNTQPPSEPQGMMGKMGAGMRNLMNKI